MMKTVLTNNKLTIALGLCFGLLLLSCRLYGQAHHYKQYTANDGLPTNAVYGGIQDQNGFIWFYTEHGLSRFDGYRFRNFTTEDGLPANDVWLIAEDKRGRIWVNTFGRRLVAIENDRVKTYYESTSEDFRGFRFIVNHGNITIHEEGTKNLLIPDKCCSVKKIPVPEELASVPEHEVFPCARDTFIRLYQNEARITRVANNGFRENYLIRQASDKWPAVSFKPDESHAAYWKEALFLWSIQENRLYYFSPSIDSLNFFDLEQVFGSAPNLVRYLPLNGQLQIQTNLGLMIVNDDLKITDTLKFNWPDQRHVHRSFKDREGNYWICTKDQGVFFLTALQRNTRLFNFDGQYKLSISCLSESSNGTMIAGARNGAIFKRSGKYQFRQLLPELPEQPIDGRKVNAICIRDSTGFWAARNQQPVEFIPFGTGTPTPRPIDFSKLPIKDHHIAHPYHSPDEKSRLSGGIKDLAWHAPTNRLCVARGTHPYILHFSEAQIPEYLELITEKRTYACAFEPSGAIWLGHPNGLGRYTAEEGYKPVTTPKILNNIYIRELLFDEDTGTLWVGTDGQGIIAYRGGAAVLVEGTGGFSVNHLDLQDNELYAATNKGVKQIKIADPLENTFLAKSFGIQEGLPSVEAQGVVADREAVYVSSSMGLAGVSRQNRHFNFRPPILYFSGIESDGEPHPPDSVVHIDMPPYQLAFNFACISFKSLGNILYHYQLIGEDKSVKTTTKRSIRYTNLSPGTYTFKVKAEDSDQQQSQEYITKVVIKSGFVRQFYLWLLATLSLLISAWLFYRWRLHRLRQQNEQETAINRQFAELELQSLQAQMNPHFVFNSLSAIQYFIAANERHQADKYLSKFAMLMRQFLESSKSRYLNLHQELHLIQLYIELEQMRFPNRFDAEVKVSSDINPYTTLIPTMLLQPFVENAINHGLFHKTEKGRLLLLIERDANQALICTLEDNGIGRTAAKGLKQQTGKAYRSRAMQITNERLHALSVIEGYNVEVEVIDLVSPDGEAAGTRIIITVPEIE